MRRLWMILLVLVIPLTASGLVQFIPPGGGGSGGGGGGAQAPSFTVATRPTGVPVGTVIAVIDGTNAQDCAVGGGTSVVQCRWNGSAWLAFGDGSTAGSGGAPDNAPYVTLAPAAGLLAEQALSLLGSGLVLNTTGTGVPTIYPGSGAVANQFMRSVTASGVASFGGVAETDLLFAVATQAELDAVQGATAPLTAPFVTTLPVAGLPAEQALSTLTTGLLRNTTGTGVPTIYPGTTCPNGFPRSLNAEGGADCQSVAEADLLYAAATQPELDAVQVALQGQIDLVAAAQLGYYVKTLQTLTQDASIDCAPPTGQFIGAIARVMATAAEVTLGAPQIVSGLATNQFCLLLGEDEVFPVEVFDGGGVQLAQAEHSVVLGPRDAMLLQWTGTTWRQVDQFSVASGGSSEAQGLQANCEVDCQLTALPEEQPFIMAPAGLAGPQEHIFSPDGNFYRVRYSSPGVLAGPEQITIEPETCWSVQANLGPPLTVLPVGSLCNVGGVNVSRQGIFEIPDASAIEFQPVPSLLATNVQSALAEVSQRTATWHLPWSAAGALVDGTTCVTQAKALINAGPTVISVVCADAAGTIEFSFDTPERYVGGAMNICFEINDPVAASSSWDAAVIAQYRGVGATVTNTWSPPVEAAVTLATAHATHFACASVTPNGAAAGVGRVFVKATIDTAGSHNDTNGRILGGYVSAP